MTFDGIDLSGLDFNRDRNRDGRPDFDQLTIQNAKFDCSKLSGASFIQFVGHGSSFKGCDLAEANFGDSRLSNTVFEDANLWKADLSDCDLRNASFDGADLHGVDFTDSDLRGATFEGAENLEDANFGGAVLDLEQRQLILQNLQESWDEALRRAESIK